MTRPNTSCLSAVGAVVLFAVAGCEVSSPQSSGATALAPAAPSPPAAAVHEVVQSYIWKQTEEGSSYHIGATPVRLSELDENVIRTDSGAICRARFHADTSEFLVEYFLERELDDYVITRVTLKEVDGQAADEILFDRETLIR